MKAMTTMKENKMTFEELTTRVEKAEAALYKINEIRNSIIGHQTVNWSEHIYPLVAALNEAGITGLSYPEALEVAKTTKQQIAEAHEILTNAGIDDEHRPLSARILMLVMCRDRCRSKEVETLYTEALARAQKAESTIEEWEKWERDSGLGSVPDR